MAQAQSLDVYSATIILKSNWVYILNLTQIEFFTNRPQYKKANIAYFVLVVKFKWTRPHDVCNLEI